MGRIMAGIDHNRHRDLTLQPTRRLFAWASAAMVVFLVAGFAAGVAIPVQSGRGHAGRADVRLERQRVRPPIRGACYDHSWPLRGHAAGGAVRLAGGEPDDRRLRGVARRRARPAAAAARSTGSCRSASAPSRRKSRATSAIRCAPIAASSAPGLDAVRTRASACSRRCAPIRSTARRSTRPSPTCAHDQRRAGDRPDHRRRCHRQRAAGRAGADQAAARPLPLSSVSRHAAQASCTASRSARWRSTSARLEAIEAMITPAVTMAMRIVHTALISGVTPRRTWL